MRSTSPRRRLQQRAGTVVAFKHGVQLGATQEPPQDLSTFVAETGQGTVIGHLFFAPGPNPSTYAFVRRDMQRNLYRIPLH